MPAPTPNSWRTAIVNFTITILVFAVVLHIAAELIRSVAVELIAAVVIAAICYGLWALARHQRDRW